MINPFVKAIADMAIGQIADMAIGQFLETFREIKKEEKRMIRLGIKPSHTTYLLALKSARMPRRSFIKKS